MNSYFRLNNIVHWVSLMLWCAALISAGVAAMNVFTVLDEGNLPLTIERYSEYPADQHPRLAASHVMEPVFTTVDLLQFVAAPLVLITLVLQVTMFRMRLRRPSNAVRAACLAIAAILFGYYATSVAPALNHQLRDWWAHAEAGELAQAADVRARFNDYHLTADNILKINLMLLIVAIGATAVAFSPNLQRANTYEAPALRKRS